jgi:hypothetical protein
LGTNIDHSRDRENDTVPPFEEYLEIRRNNAGGRSLFFGGEMGLNIPDEVYYHSVIREMQNHAIDLISLDNVSRDCILPVIRATTLHPSFIQDMVSYNIEQAVGEVHRNAVAVLMRQFDLGPQEAMNRAYECHREIQRKFIKLVDEVPSFGPEVDKAVVDYIFHMGCWVRANACWGFEHPWLSTFKPTLWHFACLCRSHFGLRNPNRQELCQGQVATGAQGYPVSR